MCGTAIYMVFVRSIMYMFTARILILAVNMYIIDGCKYVHNRSDKHYMVYQPHSDLPISSYSSQFKRTVPSSHLFVQCRHSSVCIVSLTE